MKIDKVESRVLNFEECAVTASTNRADGKPAGQVARETRDNREETKWTKFPVRS
jgi:hypothetical protein